MPDASTNMVLYFSQSHKISSRENISMNVISLENVTILSFDLYGTIVDMQSGLVEVIAPFLKARGFTGNPNSVVTWWRRTHYQDSMIDALIGGNHTPYREIGHRAISYTLKRAGIAYTDKDIRSLVTSIERLKPFPDVSASLDRLRNKFKLVVLSNGDSDMLRSATQHHGLLFDAQVSVDSAGVFKPHHKTYETAADILETNITSICHIAAHPFDCIGAKATGMHSIYVNRRNVPFGFSPYKPDLEVTDFLQLATALT